MKVKDIEVTKERTRKGERLGDDTKVSQVAVQQIAIGIANCRFVIWKNQYTHIVSSSADAGGSGCLPVHVWILDSNKRYVKNLLISAGA